MFKFKCFAQAFAELCLVKSTWWGLALIVEKRKACVWAMANFDTSRVSYSSLSKVVEKDNNNV